MASRPTAISLAAKLLTPKNVKFLKALIDVDLSNAMKAVDEESTAELLDLKKYANALTPPDTE